MPYYIVVGGNTLYRMNTAGTATALTLPTDVTIDTARRPRMAVLGKNVILTNATSRSVFVDPNGATVRLAQLKAPTSAPVLTSAETGLLTGTFRVKYTHIIKDTETGALLVESPFSPISASSGAITSKLLKAAVETSPDPGVTHRRLYRTATGPGATYYPWIDVEGNTITTVSDDLLDASLSLVAAPTELGAVAGAAFLTYMTLLVEWKGRLWGVGNVDVDKLRYTGTDLLYAWKTSYEIVIPPVGNDSFGITGLIPRRDELGVCRRNLMWSIRGDTPTTFERKKVHDGKGCVAPESVVVIEDIGYFLGADGVYTWGPDGVNCISNGKVRKWFTTTTYFNRARFENAFARYNAKYHGYELYLSNTGDTTWNRWVFYDIERGRWWGPHLTGAAFTATSALGNFIDADNLIVPIIGATDDKIYTGNNATLLDASTAISVSATSARHSEGTPDIKKLFGGPSIIFAEQAAAGNLSVACKVGAVDEGTTRTLTVDQTKPGRERFSPLGEGEHCQLVFTESTGSQACQLLGYEIPVHELGRR